MIMCPMSRLANYDAVIVIIIRIKWMNFVSLLVTVIR
jgi:hypothetical protein